MKAVFSLVLLAIASIVALTNAQGFESNSISSFSSSENGQGFGGQQVGQGGFGQQGGQGGFGRQGGQGGRGQQGFGQGQGQGAEGFGPNRDYLPPNQNGESSPGHSFGADGYRYRSPQRF